MGISYHQWFTITHSAVLGQANCFNLTPGKMRKLLSRLIHGSSVYSLWILAEWNQCLCSYAIRFGCAVCLLITVTDDVSLTKNRAKVGLTVSSVSIIDRQSRLQSPKFSEFESSLVFYEIVSTPTKHAKFRKPTVATMGRSAIASAPVMAAAAKTRVAAPVMTSTRRKP